MVRRVFKDHGPGGCCCPSSGDNPDTPACNCNELLQKYTMPCRMYYHSYLGENPFSSLTLDSTWGRVCTQHEFYHTPRPADNGKWDALYGRLGYIMGDVPPSQNRDPNYWMPHNMLAGTYTGVAERVIDERPTPTSGLTASGYRMLSEYPESPGWNGPTGTNYPVTQCGFPCVSGDAPLTGKYFESYFTNEGSLQNPSAKWIGSVLGPPDGPATVSHRNWRDRRSTRGPAELVTKSFSDFVNPSDIYRSGVGCRIAENRDIDFLGNDVVPILQDGSLMELTLDFNGTEYKFPKLLPRVASLRWSDVYTIWGMTGSFATGLQANGPKATGTNYNYGRDMPVDISFSYRITKASGGGIRILASVDFVINYLDVNGDFPPTGIANPDMTPLLRRCAYTLNDGSGTDQPQIDNSYPQGTFSGRKSVDLTKTLRIWANADGNNFTSTIGLGAHPRYVDTGLDMTYTFSFSNT